MASAIFLQELLAQIQRCLPAQASGEFCVAFSGGLDSSVLLHAMAQIVSSQPQWRLRALHIDHQLQAASTLWREHCAAQCALLEVEFAAEQIDLNRPLPEGLEAGARTARYEVLRRQLRRGETLLTAHHADDQLETVLLALVRGSGVGGLAAMPDIKHFAAGWHLRPLLSFTRQQLHAWAQLAGVQWVDDPSNAQLRFDRNYLRSEVLPKLRARWPSVAHSAVRSAAHLAEARELLAAVAADDLTTAAVGRCLDMRVLRALSPPRRRNLIRYWLEQQQARVPSTRKLAALEHDMLVAHPDRTPEARWDNIEVRRHGERLYCDIARQAFDAQSALIWSWSQSMTLPSGLGELHMQPSMQRGLAQARLPGQLHVRFRRGGERIRLAGHAQRSHLKNLLQEAQVLPWWRDRLPLLYAGNQLIAVADRWIADEFTAKPGEMAVRIVWTSQPTMYAVGADAPNETHPMS
jgi:tRNA(Ile)-lysidine synthase